MFLNNVLLPAILLTSLVVLGLIFLNPMLASEAPDSGSISIPRLVSIWLIFGFAFAFSFLGSYIKKSKSEKYAQRIHLLQSIWFLIPVWALAFYLLSLG